MSTFSSFLPSKLLNINNRDRSSDPLSRLRFALETMPGSRKYEFTPLTRTEIITELYEAFWGTHVGHFVPNPSGNLPLHTSLHELQQRQGFGGAGKERKPTPGRACGNIFRKGECCFRCRCVTSSVPINHLDLDPPPIPAIAHGMIAVSFAHGVSTLQAMRATMSASLLLNNPGVVVTAETVKHGGYQSAVHIIPQQKVPVKRQRLSLAA